MRRQWISLLQCGLRKLRLHIPRQRDHFQVPDGPSVEDCYPWWLEEDAPTWRTNTALYKIQLDQDSAVAQKGTTKLVQFSTKSLKLSRHCNRNANWLANWDHTTVFNQWKSRLAQAHSRASIALGILIGSSHMLMVVGRSGNYFKCCLKKALNQIHV
mgnify:FL=1